MEAARRAMCTDDLFNPLITTFVQACSMLVVSQLFHTLFKPLGQPGPVAQILAGLVLGPTLLCRIKRVNDLFVQPNVTDYNLVISFIFRILFMFLIGLETDIPYLRRNLRQTSLVAYGGLVVCSVFGAATSFFVIHMLKIVEHKFAFANIVMIVLANSASPLVIRLVAELKFETADVGRLAISASLINEMTCILWYAVVIAFTSRKMLGRGVLCLVLTGIVIVLNRFSAIWFNRRNHNHKYVQDTEMLTILCCVIVVSFFVEESGYNSTVSCFLVGLMFPREGKTTRTLLRKLTYAVNNFILPIYFGFQGFHFDIRYLGSLRNFVFVALVILLSIGGKIIGTLAVCHYLKIPRNEGVILAFILNLKGNSELLLIDIVPKSDKWWDQKVHNLVVIVVVLSTIIAGPVVSLILKQEGEHVGRHCTSLEFHDPESELRMLVCVYGSRNISAKVGLVSALHGLQRAPIMPYLMHLVELPKRQSKNNKMYHELQDGEQFSDEDDYGGNDVIEINDAVDAFALDSKVLIRQRKLVSSFVNMYEDVCCAAENLRVSIIFLSFHKHQRLDGKLESSKEGFRITNQKILRHAPCSVGIFVDRGHTGFQQPSIGMVQNVATIFFGGPDDREALACSKRIACHPHINLTIVRFLAASSTEHYDASYRDDEEMLTITSNQVESTADNIFMEEFYNRYVKGGEVGYVEKYVRNGGETVEVLREMKEMYKLMIIGRRRGRKSPLTQGLSDWEECPELGTVGDFLASSELNLSASILVIQHHTHPTNLTSTSSSSHA